MHHEHEHTHDCGCGHDHEHDHHHHHEHGEDCDCGCHGEVIEILPVEGMTVLQQNLLLGLYERRYLPVASFSLGREDQEEPLAVALAPVYIGDRTDTMERVREVAEALGGLETGGLITLDYDVPLAGYAYAEFKQSALYAYFAQTVREGAKLPDAAFNKPMLELGSMALTEAGAAAVDEMIQQK